MVAKANIHLYTTFYNEKNEHRRSELIEALTRNCQLNNITSVTIFNEGSSLKKISPSKIFEIPVDRRPNYSDFTEFINSKPKNNDIHIIANTDIYFDENIGVLLFIELKNTCFALGRWDTTESLKPELYNHNDSQDVWVFRGSINSELNSNYPLGVPRCDNRFMFDLEEVGYKVLNPAFSIKAFHLHEGQVHVVYKDGDNTYNIQPPYRYKYPHNLYNLFHTFMFNLKSPYKLGSYRYDLKKVNGWMPIRIYRGFFRLLTGRDPSLIGYDISQK